MSKVIRQLATGVLTAGMIANSASACITPDELRADKLRFLDMQLRVAALKCRATTPGLVSLYNEFVRTHRPAIIASRRPVERFVARHTNKTMDDYVTGRANKLSYESIGNKGFCKTEVAIARFATELADPGEAVDLLPLAYQAPAAGCPVTTAEVAPTAKGVARRQLGN